MEPATAETVLRSIADLPAEPGDRCLIFLTSHGEINAGLVHRFQPQLIEIVEAPLDIDEQALATRRSRDMFLSERSCCEVFFERYFSRHATPDQSAVRVIGNPGHL